MKEISLNVEGMMCDGCENRIKNALSTIKNIKNIEANHKNGTVNIKTKDDVDENEIKNKINNLGFKVKE